MATKRTPKQNGKKAGQHVLHSDVTAIYARVSTDNQVENGNGLDYQVDTLKNYCTLHNYTLDEQNIFIDAGISGTSLENRTAFNKMIEFAKAGKITRIIALKIDRIARNLKDLLETVDILKESNVELVLIKDNVDTSNPQGIFFLQILGSLAQLEATMITERVMNGKMQNAKNAGYNGSNIPLGYDYLNNAFSINQTESRSIRIIFDLYLREYSLRSIADYLNNNGFVTKTGKKFYAQTVLNVLNNGCYAGLVQYDGIENDGTVYPSIISKEQFEQARIRIDNAKVGNPNFSKKIEK